MPVRQGLADGSPVSGIRPGNPVSRGEFRRPHEKNACRMVNVPMWYKHYRVNQCKLVRQARLFRGEIKLNE